MQSLKGEKETPTKRELEVNSQTHEACRGIFVFESSSAYFHPVKSSGVEGDVSPQLFRLCFKGGREQRLPRRSQ